MIAQWAVGLLVVFLVLKVVKGSFTGIFAVIMMTVVPWGVGKFLFQLLEIAQHGCK
jgi:hypothetical protein